MSVKRLSRRASLAAMFAVGLNCALTARARAETPADGWISVAKRSGDSPVEATI